MTSDSWKYDLEEYIKQGEPDAAQKELRVIMKKDRYLHVDYRNN